MLLILNFAVLTAVSLILSGCCFCTKPDNSYSIELGFSADSLGGSGFQKEELKSVYVVIYSKPQFSGVTDTMRQTGPFASSSSELNIYVSPQPNSHFTFSLYAMRNTPWSYRVFVPVTGKTFDIDNFSDIYTGDGGSCNCQYTSGKRFTVNGQPQVQPIRDGNNPVVILPR